MSEQPFNPLPRKALIAIAALIGFTLLVVVVARLTGYNAHQAPDSPVVKSRDLRFTEGPDGVVAVADAANGTRIAMLPAGNEGFVRGVLRFMERDRRARHTTADTPFRLAVHADGRMTLTDLGSQRVLELNSFGPTNTGAFSGFLTARGPVAAPAADQDTRPAQAGQTGKTF